MLRARLLPALLIAALAPVATAHATDIGVSTIDDVVAADGACSLREAVIAADSNLPSADCPAGQANAVDHISVPASGAHYFLSIAGVDEDLAATGDLDLTGGDLLITGAGQGQTIIDGGGIDRVFDVLSDSVELRDLSITGGHAPDGSNGDEGEAESSGADSIGTNGTNGENGGGIRTAAALTLLRVTVSGNQAGRGGSGGAGGIGGAGAGAQDGGDSVGGAGVGGGRGGGIYSDAGTVVMTDSTFSANHGGAGGAGGAGGTGGLGGDSGHNGGASIGGMAGDGGSGGAISADQGSLTITRTVFQNNAAGDSGAGGDGGTGGAGGSGGLTSGGNSTGGQGFFGGFGGAIDETNTSLSVVESTFDSNHAGDGGHGGNGGAGGDAGTDGVNFGLAGQGVGGSGGLGASAGAISAFNNSSGTVTIARSLVFDNDAGAGGAGGDGGTAAGVGTSGSKVSTGGAGGSGGPSGGIDLAGAGSITNSTITQNVSGSGGAGGYGGNGATTSNGGNGANGGSPGGVQHTTSGSLVLLHDTIADNAPGLGGTGGAPGAGGTAHTGSAGSDGAVANVREASAGDTVMRNTILHTNGANTCGGTVTDGGHNLSFPDTDASCAADVTGDPLLGPVKDNGGPTRTMLPAAGSPALDAVPASGAFCAAEDARNVPRPRGAACDIGAVERSAPTATTGAATGTTVAAKVNPDGLAGTAHFDFGKTAAYGSHTADTAVAAGTADVDLGTDLGALEADTTYHYRVVLVTPDGTVNGTDATFKTEPAPVTPPPGGGGTPPPGGGNTTPFAGVVFGAKRLKVDRKGRATITLTCPAATKGPCTGRLTLTARIAKKRRAIGSKRFTIATGKTVRLRITLSAKARRALKQAGRLNVAGAAAAKDSTGQAKTTRATLTFKRKR